MSKQLDFFKAIGQLEEPAWGGGVECVISTIIDGGFYWIWDGIIIFPFSKISRTFREQRWKTIIAEDIVSGGL